MDDSFKRLNKFLDTHNLHKSITLFIHFLFIYFFLFPMCTIVLKYHNYVKKYNYKNNESVIRNCKMYYF